MLAPESREALATVEAVLSVFVLHPELLADDSSLEVVWNVRDMVR